MPISGVNLTPRPTAVYASDPALPRRPQDSLPSCLLGFERTRLALASSYQLPIAPRTGLLSKVRRDRRSGLGRPIQFRSVGSGRRGHAGSGAVSGACVGLHPSFDPSLHALRHQPVGRRCSRLYRYSAAVQLLRPSGPALAPRLPEPTRDRRGGCGRPEVSQVPTRSVTARTGLRLRRSDGPSHDGPARIACGGLQRLGLHDIGSFEAQYSPRRLAMYASRPPSPTTPQHALPGGRYPLPGPDFHRLDRASFAWRTQTEPSEINRA